LRRGALTIQFRVIENEKDPHPFCFGYHPYLQIDNEPLDDLEIQTDIHTLLEFNEVLPLSARTSYPSTLSKNGRSRSTRRGTTTICSKEGATSS
jgi:galactose mutarotase-like enzyme